MIVPEIFTVDGKQAALYRARAAECPLVVMNSFTDEADRVLTELDKLAAPDFHLLSITGISWEQDLTPWYCPALFANEADYSGGADEYLELLAGEIIPRAKRLLDREPTFTAISGYSLAGLFALYSLYRCDAFSRAASMSGSLWYPNFISFIESTEMRSRPEKIYISLGDRESRTSNPVLRTVQENTETAVGLYRRAGIDVTWELNPGNHFKNAALRSARGIKAIIS